MSDDEAPTPDEVTVAAPEEPDRNAERRRADRAPWWRLGIAALAVGALTWAASASDGVLQLDAGQRADGDLATTTGPAGPEGETYVDAARLVCPGTVPSAVAGAQETLRGEVLAAGVPRSVVDAVPPVAPDDSTQTAAPDTATATGDTATTTGGPDAAASTAPVDGARTTSLPDDAVGTAAPTDAASATGGPDGAVTTHAPEETSAPAAGASVLRTTGGDGPVRELQHGIPVAFLLEEAEAAVVDAGEGMAPGVLGGQLVLGTDAGTRGLSVTGCVAAAETQWLVGGGAGAGRSEQLVLTNPGPDPVTVDVAVWSTDGPVEATGASGIVVPGDARVVELLDGLAPGAEAPVLAVTATGGPVVAHLAESFREGTTDRGTEVVPPVAAPATDLVVPALPAAPEGHEHRVVLRVAAPGDADAVVDLTALTADGVVRLVDQVTRVRAGHTVELALEDLPEGATALRLRSDQPVTAGARLEVLPAETDPEIVEAGADEDIEDENAEDENTEDEDAEEGTTEQDEPLLRAAGDLAWVGATTPGTTPAGMALPYRESVPTGSAALALTAVDGTTAWVTWVDEEGAETAQSVDLPNDTTVLLDVPSEARAVWVVGAGPAGVVSAVHLHGVDERGPFVASTTVPGLPWLRQVTQVLPVVP